MIDKMKEKELIIYYVDPCLRNLPKVVSSKFLTENGNKNQSLILLQKTFLLLKERSFNISQYKEARRISFYSLQHIDQFLSSYGSNASKSINMKEEEKCQIGE